MFAPGSGPYLLLGWFAIATGTVLDLAGTLPARTAVLLLLVGAAALWLFLTAFFRDPERAPGRGIVSAADGRVLSVDVSGGRLQIAVFMNVTDVHVNRFPLDATVNTIDPEGAGHRPAYAPDASHNLSLHYGLRTSIGDVEVVQRTGIVARRLVPLTKVGRSHRKGERLGMIVLGSRVDVTLPSTRARATVRPGDRVRAGTSTIAEVTS